MTTYHDVVPHYCAQCGAEIRLSADQIKIYRNGEALRCMTCNAAWQKKAATVIVIDGPHIDVIGDERQIVIANMNVSGKCPVCQRDLDDDHCEWCGMDWTDPDYSRLFFDPPSGRKSYQSDGK